MDFIQGSTRRDELYRIALGQCGLFTAKQAVESGYADSEHPRYVRTGQWTRELRGIYRLVHYPYDKEEQLAQWALWTVGRQQAIQGIYSHETALVIHELSDVNPHKLHMTVPPRFRRQRVPGELVLHRAVLPPQDIIDHEVYLVTTPYRTLRDVIAARSTSPDLIVQAAAQAIQRGKLRWKDIDKLEQDTELDQLLLALIRTELRYVLSEDSLSK